MFAFAHLASDTDCTEDLNKVLAQCSNLQALDLGELASKQRLFSLSSLPPFLPSSSLSSLPLSSLSSPSSLSSHPSHPAHLRCCAEALYVLKARAKSQLTPWVCLFAFLCGLFVCLSVCWRGRNACLQGGPGCWSRPASCRGSLHLPRGSRSSSSLLCAPSRTRTSNAWRSAPVGAGRGSRRGMGASTEVNGGRGGETHVLTHIHMHMHKHRHRHTDTQTETHARSRARVLVAARAGAAGPARRC